MTREEIIKDALRDAYKAGYEKAVMTGSRTLTRGEEEFDRWYHAVRQAFTTEKKP